MAAARQSLTRWGVDARARTLYGVSSSVGLAIWSTAPHPSLKPLPGGEGDGGLPMHANEYIVIDDRTRTTQVLVQVALTLLR